MPTHLNNNSILQQSNKTLPEEPSHANSIPQQPKQQQSSKTLPEDSPHVNSILQQSNKTLPEEPPHANSSSLA